MTLRLYTGDPTCSCGCSDVDMSPLGDFIYDEEDDCYRKVCSIQTCETLAMRDRSYCIEHEPTCRCCDAYVDSYWGSTGLCDRHYQEYLPHIQEEARVRQEQWEEQRREQRRELEMERQQKAEARRARKLLKKAGKK